MQEKIGPLPQGTYNQGAAEARGNRSRRPCAIVSVTQTLASCRSGGGIISSIKISFSLNWASALKILGHPWLMIFDASFQEARTWLAPRYAACFTAGQCLHSPALGAAHAEFALPAESISKRAANSAQPLLAGARAVVRVSGPKPSKGHLPSSCSHPSPPPASSSSSGRKGGGGPGQRLTHRPKNATFMCRRARTSLMPPTLDR